MIVLLRLLTAHHQQKVMSSAVSFSKRCSSLAKACHLQVVTTGAAP